MHGDGLAVERSGLIFPLLQSVHGCLLQQGGAGDNLHCGHTPAGVDQRVNGDVAGHMLVLGKRRLNRRHGRNEFCLFHITANGKRGGWRRWLIVDGDAGVERFRVWLVVTV